MDDDQVRDEHGRILRDNVFGSQEEDAMRRDFTVNALFYDPATQEILDYCGGFADLRKRVIRMIGEAEVRYREDPVRMLRAVRLAAKLGSHIEPRTRAPIRTLATLMQNVPPARLFDEMLKLLLSGHATVPAAAAQRGPGPRPAADAGCHPRAADGRAFRHAGADQDRPARREDKPVSPAFLFAALLWHEVLAAWKKQEGEGMKPIPALQQAMEEVIAVQVEKLAIPRRYTTDMKEIWALQPRLLNRAGRRPYKLLEHPRLRAGFDFLELRAESGEVDREVVDWWARFQRAGEEERAHMLLPDKGGAKRRRRRRRPAGGSPGDEPAAADDAVSAT